MGWSTAIKTIKDQMQGVENTASHLDAYSDNVLDLEDTTKIKDVPIIILSDNGAPANEGEFARDGDLIKFRDSAAVRVLLTDKDGYDGTIDIADNDGVTTHHLTFTDGLLTGYSTS